MMIERLTLCSHDSQYMYKSSRSRHFVLTKLPQVSTEADTNGLHFAGDSFKCIFLIEKVWILIHISLKIFLNDPVNIISTLVQIMAWHRAGDKPLSEPMMAYMTDAYMRHSVSRSYGHLSILFTHSSTFLTHTNRVKTSLNALKHIRCLNVLYGVKVFKMCSSNATGDRSSNKLQWLKPASNDLGVYVNKFGKASVVWRYTLQSIGPSGIALKQVFVCLSTYRLFVEQPVVS